MLHVCGIHIKIPLLLLLLWSGCLGGERFPEPVRNFLAASREVCIDFSGIFPSSPPRAAVSTHLLNRDLLKVSHF